MNVPYHGIAATLSGTWYGPYWGEFRTIGGITHDGKPAIYCEPLTALYDPWIITAERWICERLAGRIVEA